MSKKIFLMFGFSLIAGLALFVSAPAQAQTNCSPNTVYKIQATDRPSSSSNKITPPAGCTGPIKKITPVGIATLPTADCRWTYGNDTNGAPVKPFGFRYGGRDWGLSRWDATTNQAVLYFYDATDNAQTYVNNYGSCKVRLTWTVGSSVPPSEPPVPPPTTPTENCKLEIVNNSNPPYKVGSSLDFRFNISGCKTPAFLTWSIDWGEGAEAEGHTSSAPLNNESHTFSKDGTYQINARAYTSDNATNFPLLAFPGVSGQTSVTIGGNVPVPPTTPDSAGYELKLSLDPQKDFYFPGENITIKARVVNKTTGAVVNTEDGDGRWLFDFGTLGLNKSVGFGGAVELENSETQFYPQPGSYTITVALVDDSLKPKIGNLTGSLAVKIGSACQAPAGSVTSPGQVFSALDANKPVKIAFPSLASWVNLNAEAFRDYVSDQQCQIVNATLSSLKGGLTVLNSIKKSTDAKLPVKFTLISLNKNEGGIPFTHALIALSVKKQGSNYNVEVLDSTGPNISTLQCKNKSATSPITNQKFFGLVCNFSESSESVSDFSEGGILLMTNVDKSINDGLKTARTSYCKSNSQEAICKRANVASWLKSNYPPIGNFSNDSSPLGNCAGWSYAALKFAYLADFVGECKPASLPLTNQLAAPGFLSLLQLLLFPFNLQPNN